MREVVDKACCGSHTHTSFQIRMPYIKGMLHQVDFKDFLKRSGHPEHRGHLGQRRTLSAVWTSFSPQSIQSLRLATGKQYDLGGLLDAFRDYNHALYITNLSKTEPEKLVELNYQFLSTLSIQPEEFRPAGLPGGLGPQSEGRSPAVADQGHRDGLL